MTGVERDVDNTKLTAKPNTALYALQRSARMYQEVLHQTPLPGPICMPASASVKDLCGEFMRHKRSCALVVNETGEQPFCTGIVTERDISRTLAYWDSGDTPSSKLPLDKVSVSDLMTPVDNMIIVRPGDSLEKCRRLMQTHGIRHLPVVGDRPSSNEEGLVVIIGLLKTARMYGILSAKNVMEALPTSGANAAGTTAPRNAA